MIRLQRVGRKHDPAYRVVAVDSRRGPQSGRFLEVLGSYNARRGGPQFKVERIKHWLSVGAQTSGTLHNLFVDQKIIAGPKINVLPGRELKEKEVSKLNEVKESPKVGIDQN